MAAMILDTNIISNAYLPDPPQWLLGWLASLPPESVVITWPVIYETEYGIRCSERHNPGKSAFVLEWFEEFLQRRMILLDMDVNSARILGRMAACPALRNMFETPPLMNRNGEVIKNKKIKIGADAIIAAMAIAHDTPIASLNTRDFVHINSFFPIPGVYDPKLDDWVVDPPPGWGFCENANDDRGETPDRKCLFRA